MSKNDEPSINIGDKHENLPDKKTELIFYKIGLSVEEEEIDPARAILLCRYLMANAKTDFSLAFGVIKDNSPPISLIVFSVLNSVSYAKNHGQDSGINDQDTLFLENMSAGLDQKNTLIQDNNPLKLPTSPVDTINQYVKEAKFAETVKAVLNGQDHESDFQKEKVIEMIKIYYSAKKLSQEIAQQYGVTNAYDFNCPLSENEISQADTVLSEFVKNPPLSQSERDMQAVYVDTQNTNLNFLETLLLKYTVINENGNKISTISGAIVPQQPESWDPEFNDKLKEYINFWQEELKKLH